MRRLLRGLMAVVFLVAAGALPAAAGGAAGARQSLEIGIKAYREGAIEASVEALSGALEEGLGSGESALALYYRGLAYRALGKPGQAIADLTGAIAVKNGLPPAQLADAEDNRTSAYAEAGISSSESVVVGKPAKRSRASSAREPKSQSFLTTTSIDAPEPATSPWERATIAPVPVSAAAARPEKRPPVSSLTTTSIDAAEPAPSPREKATIAPVPVSAAARPEKRPPASSAREPKSQSFLTTTSIDAAEPVPSPWERATIAPVPVPAAARPEKRPPASSAREPRPQSFLTTTSIDAAKPAPSPWGAAAIVPPPPRLGEPTPFATEVLPGGAPSSTAAGRIRLQVARVQTQSEAYALAVRLVSQHGTEFSSDMLKIERAVAENKQPVFLVRLGPFANADQAQKRCSALRRGGFDCVVLY